MTSEKLEQRLASAVEKTAPNDVNGVLSRCEERKGTVIPMTAKKTAKKTTKRKWTTLVAACLAVMLLGGGRISYYLARQMLDFGASVKIIESSAAVCDSLAERLPEATIIHGDGTSEQLLAEEGIAKMDAVASLTGIDEENVLMSLYARSVSSAKIVTKINRTTFSHIIKGMDLGSVFHPRYIAADHIVRYVRAMQNSLGSNVETLYKIVGNKAEALEFRATEKSAVCGRPLMELPTRPNLLIGAINREGRIITPGGRDTIEPGDTVVVVTAATGLDDLDDILDKRRVKA